MIAPCVDILRHLTRLMNGVLGSEQGTLHAPVDLTVDIPILMKSLKEHNVYIVQGRVLNPDDGSAVPDVVSVGLQNLTDSSRSPLVDYNKAFLDLQMRRRMKPLVPIIPASREQATSPLITTHPTSSSEHIHTATTLDIEIGGDDSDNDDDDLFEGMTEFEKIMEENDEEDQTLTQDSSRDVALDMDADMLGDCSDEEGSDGEDSDMFDDFGAGVSLSSGDDDFDL